jgi:hypothetical protein
MNPVRMPSFTAHASLYSTTRRYIGSGSAGSGSGGAASVALAYYPGSDTQARCSDCLETCAQILTECSAAASSIVAGCLFPPACPAAVAAAGEAQGVCNTASLSCQAVCDATKCCPHLCGFPNPLDPGSGCCDKGEHCVDASDPNSRGGCCPAERATCGGKCCDLGDQCCGNNCCPAGHACCGGTCCPSSGTHCCGDVCCDANVPCCGNMCCSLLPPGPPPPPPPHNCAPGAAPCGFPDSTGVIRTCCPPGLQCCGVTTYADPVTRSIRSRPNCGTNCIG